MQIIVGIRHVTNMSGEYPKSTEIDNQIQTADLKPERLLIVRRCHGILAKGQMC